MESDKFCACKGIRTCLQCEIPKYVETTKFQSEKISYTYCSHCKAAWYDEEESNNNDRHPHHSGDRLDFAGVTILEDFITEDEENGLVAEIDKTPWVDSQSGRRKQDYGPKVNFKKKRLKTSVFTGLPYFSKVLVDRMKRSDVLEDFEPVELCNLEYDSERGSAIASHFDDFWLWGERLVTLNMLTETKHTMTIDSRPHIEVLITLPPRSLVVVQGSARHQWKHAIKRADIIGRRVATTFRELTAEFLQGGENESVGRELLELSATFKGLAVGCNGTS